MYFSNYPIGKMFLKNPEMFWYFVPKTGLRVVYARLFKKKLRTKYYAGHWVKTQDQGNEILTNALLSGKPFMFGRHGSNELLCAGSGLSVKKGITSQADCQSLENSCLHCGLYPNTTETMLRFTELIIQATQQADIYGCFRWIWED